MYELHVSPNIAEISTINLIKKGINMEEEIDYKGHAEKYSYLSRVYIRIN